MTTVIVSHRVSDVAAWKQVFDEHGAARSAHGRESEEVLTDAADERNVTIVMRYPSAAQAHAFLDDPSLKEAMGRAGVEGPPEIRVLEALDVEASLR